MAKLTLDDLEAMEPGDVVYDYDGDEVTLTQAGHWEYTCINGDRNVASLEWCANELVRLGATGTPRAGSSKELAELMELWESLTPEDQLQFRNMML